MPRDRPAMKTLERMNLSLASEDGNDALRQLVASKKQRLAEVNSLVSDAFDLQPELATVQSKEWADDLSAKQIALRSAEERLSIARSAVDAAVRALKQERESDLFAAHLAALVDHGSQLGLQDGHCPLCDAFRSNIEYALAAARTKLAGRDEKLAAAQLAVTKAARTVLAEQENVNQVREAAVAQTIRRDGAFERLQHIGRGFDQLAFKGSPERPDLAQATLLDEQEEVAGLERALFILDASGAVDGVATWQNRVNVLRAAVESGSAKLADTERAVTRAREIQATAKTVANQISAEQFDTVMPLLQELYPSILRWATVIMFNSSLVVDSGAQRVWRFCCPSICRDAGANGELFCLMTQSST